MTTVNVWSYLAIVGLLALSAFFSGSEIAYAKSNRLRLRAATEEGSLLAKVAYYIYQAYDNALVTILIGNNLVNIAASSLATVIAVALIGDNGAWIATLIMTVLIITFGEIVPKIVASQVPEGFARAVSIPLRALMTLLFPFVWLLSLLLNGVDKLLKKRVGESPSVTEEDLETILDTVEDEGVIDEDRADLLQSALDFDEVLAYEILTPRVDMVAIDIDDEKDEILRTIFDSPYSRIPIYRDTVDNVIGVLHLNRVFKALADGAEINLSQMMMPATFVYKTMALPDVLKVMKKRKSHLVVVTDEYGGTMGVLSMEDVLEQLVGDIWDESDEVDEEIVSLGGGRFDVDADMRIEDFFEELDIDDRDFDDDNTTLGGWAIEQLGRYPRVGDQFDYRNLTITIKKRRKLRVIRLLVVAHPVEEESEYF
ncbi:MAG: hemolysin family protein [Clostridiaceae bacterium]